MGKVMGNAFVNLKNLLKDDFSTRNSDFLSIVAKCGIIATFLFMSCFIPFFVWVAFVASILFALTQFNGRSIYYLVFLLPLMGIFKKDSSSLYLLAYILCAVLLMFAAKLIYEVFIKRTKKINWWFSIVFVITLIYFMMPFTFPDFSTTFSLILGLCLVFACYYYKEDLDAKELGLIFIFGVLCSIFIGLFYDLSPRLQSLVPIFYAYGLERFSGAYTNPNILAGEMMFALAIIYTFVINKQVKLVHYPIILIFEIALLFSMSKSGLIIFAVNTFLFIVLYVIKNHRWKDLINPLIVLASIGVILLIFRERFFTSFGRITSAIKENPIIGEGSGSSGTGIIVNMEELTTGRSTIWTSYLDAIFSSFKSAMFGYGVGAPYIGEYAGFSEWCPHNTYLQCLYFVGILGVMLMVALLITSNGIKKFKDINWYNFIPITALGLYLFSLEFFSFRLAIYIIVSLYILTSNFGEYKLQKVSSTEFWLGTEINLIIKKLRKEVSSMGDIKVLHLLASNKFSGAENVACQIVGAVGENVEFAYASPDGDIAKSLSERNINYLPMKKFNFKELKRVVNVYNPTIIHAHDVKAVVLATLINMKIPVVAHIHLNHPKARKFSIRSLIMNYCLTRKKVKHIIWVSNSCYNDYKFHEKVREKSEIITNIIDGKALNLKAENADICDEADIVYLGRLTYQKYPERMLAIIKLMVKDCPNLKVAIVGSGDLLETCKILAKEYGVASNITFYGFLSNGYGILKNSKVFLLTSRYEGYPMCVLEAQALGLPIVSPNLGELNNLVINEKTGLIYDSDEEAVNCLKKLLSDDYYYNKMRNNVKDFSTNYNNVEKYRDKMIEIYINANK